MFSYSCIERELSKREGQTNVHYTTHYTLYTTIEILRLIRSDRLTALILPDVFVNCGTFDSSPTHPCIISLSRVLFLLSQDLFQVQAQSALHIKCLAPVCLLIPWLCPHHQSISLPATLATHANQHNDNTPSKTEQKTQSNKY